MSDPQPELRWAPLPPAPKRTGRVWLTIGLSVAALVIVGAVLFFLLPRGGTPAPMESATASPTPSQSPTPSDSPTTEPEPAETATAAPPSATDPSLDAFRGQVSGWLDDALQGLDIVSSSSGQDALAVVDTLQQDALRLSDAQAPSSIGQQWRDGVAAYAQQLSELRDAVAADSGVDTAIDGARAAAKDLRAVVGL